MNAIETVGLSKRYGRTLALDSLDLAVREGEVYGYLGPNGAGNTTTIRLLLGLHRATARRATLFGIDAWADPVTAHRRVAYVPGEPFLWSKLTASETLEFLARLHGGSDVAYRDELIERFRLDASKRVRALSKGNRQKVQLVAALASRADLLILDEPTGGLDPLMRRDVGVGLLGTADTAEPSLSLLSSPAAQALRDERGRLAAWAIGGGLFAIVIGVLADSVSSVNVPQSLDEQLQKLGVSSVTSASGYIAFTFLIFILLVCLFAVSQVVAARHEEAGERPRRSRRP